MELDYSQAQITELEGLSAQERLDKIMIELADIKRALDVSTIVAITDTKGVITYVNDAFCKISRYSREEVLGKTHRIVNSGYHSKAFFQNMWEVIGAGKIWRDEIRNRAKDGTFYWVSTTIVPFLDSSGSPYQYVAIRHDITKQKRVEEEVRLLNEELEDRVQERTNELVTANRELKSALYKLQESERLRETFVAALTHDMRTPLVGEKRALALLADEKDALPQELAVLVNGLVASNDSLLRLVNTLLEIYQYEAGQVKLVPVGINLFQLVKECIFEMSILAEVQHIELDNQIPPGFPEVMADHQQLKRVFMNLLGNAVENIPAGSRVEIKAQQRHESIFIEVRDNGNGISADILPHLFERYFLSQKTKKIGSGLGLYICKMIIEHHGGNIGVKSHEGTGTTIYIELPIS